MKPETSEHSRELFHLIVENVQDFAIFMTDLQGRIRSWNPGVERLLGYSEAEFIGQPASLIFAPEADSEQVASEQEMRTALAAGRAEDRRWHKRKDGARFWGNGLLMLLRNEAGEPRGFAKILRDETARKQSEEELRRAHDELERRVEERTRELQQMSEDLRAEATERRLGQEQITDLLRRIIDTQEIERRRIARDLHDNLGQQLTGLRLNLDLLKETCGAQAEVCQRIEQTQEIAKRIEAEVDFIAWELRPAALDHLGLAAALDTFVQEWAKHYQMAAEFHSTGFSDLRLSAEIEINLYRIAQEALNNITKHAAASHAAVLLERRDQQGVLIIEDDGQGFDPSTATGGEKGMGLLSMRERAEQVGGRLEIETTPGAGTAVYVRVPLRYAATKKSAPVQ